MVAERTTGRSRSRARWLLVVALASAASVVGLSGRPALAHSPHDVIVSIAVSPDFDQDSTVYAIVREYLLESTDGGDTWRRLNRGLDYKQSPSSVVIDATDPDRLYLSTRGSGVYRSDDAGASWTSASDEPGEHRNILSLALSPDDGDHLFAVTPGGEVVTTADGGEAWEVVDGLADEDVMAVAFAPDDGDTVFAGAHGAVLRSDDRGRTWEETQVGDDAEAVTAVAPSPTFGADGTVFAGMADSGVYRSTDGGRSFDRTSSGLDDERIEGLLVSPGFDGDATVWTSTWEAGVFRSNDAGDRWTRTSENLTTDTMADDLGRPHFTAVEASVAAGNETPTLFVAGFDGLFRSTDGAESWEELTTQDSTNIGALAVSPAYPDDGSLAVSAYLNGAFRSDDRGETWTAINTGLAARNEWLRQEDYVNRLTGIDFSPDHANDRALYVGSRGYFFHSDDRGDTWEPTVPDGTVVPDEFPPDYVVTAFSPDFTENRTLYAGSDGGRVLRADDGRSLELVAEIGVEIVALEVVPDGGSDEGLIAATTEGIHLGSDRGETWEAVEGSPDAILSLAVSPNFASDATAFVGTKNGLFVSRDGGVGWTLVGDQPFGERPYVEVVAASPAFAEDGTVLVSARGLGLFRSTDGGETFTPTGEDLLDDNVVLASFYHPTSAPIVFSPGFATDRTVFGIAESTIHRSTDAGESWEPLTIPRTVHPATEESAPNELLVTPRAGDLEAHAHGEVTQRTRAQADRTVLVLSTNRVLGAAVVAIGALVLLSVLKVGTRTTPARLAVAVRLMGGGLVFAVALFFLTNR